MKQTAVEWLEEQIEIRYGLTPTSLLLFRDAKEMEKQQMKDAVLAQCTTHEGLRKIFDKQFEQYYNETFNSKRGLKEVQLKDPNTCEYYKEFGCVKDICNCYTLISKQETLEEAVENRIKGINVNTGFNK